MTENVKEIEDSALKLDKESRIHLTNKLIQSVHGPIDSDINDAWEEEILKRKQGISSGEVSLVPGQQVHEEARKYLKK